MQSLPPTEVQPLPLTDFTAQLYGKDEPNLKQILSILRRRIPLVAGVAIAATSAVWLWTLTRTPIYESKFQVLVEPITGNDKSQQLLESNSVNSTPLNSTQFLSDFDYETQIEVLRSPKLLEPTIEVLQKSYPEIQYAQLVKSIDVLRLRNTKILVVSYRDRDRTRTEIVSRQLAKDYLDYSLSQRQTDLRKGIQFVDEQLPTLRERVNQLQAKLQAFRQQYGLIDPESRGGELSERLSAVQKRREEAESQLTETRSLYANLRQQVGYQPNQAILASTLSEAPRYQKLLDQIQEVDAQIATETVRFRRGAPMIQALEEKRRHLLPLLQQEAEKTLRNRQPANQGDGNLTATVLELNKQLITTANQLQVLQARNTALAAIENQLAQQFLLVPTLARQYTDLQRELKVATDSLNRFLSTRESLQLDAARKALPWQLVSPPVKPQNPVFPSTSRSLGLGVVAGLLLGIGAALLAEKLDNVFHSPTDVRDLTRLPLLGIIPFHRGLAEASPTSQFAPGSRPVQLLLESETPPSKTVRPDPDRKANPSYVASPFQEAFRSLRTNVRLLSSDRPIRSIVISSAIPEEGKSTVALHLARAGAAMGQRVLLVDADLRRPQLHLRLDLQNVRGLSNLIAQNLSIEDVLQRSPKEENLFVLTSGQIPPDPTKLLSSQRMQGLIQQFEAAFDFVIYDTPPLLGLADSSLLTTHTDGIIVVVGLGRTDRPTLMMALDGLRVTSAPILGIIANGTKAHTTSTYDYHHRYYTQVEV